MPTLHNCHTHIFTTKNVPDDYFPLKLKDILARRHTSDFIVKLLHDLNPNDDSDRWDHLAAFLNVGNCNSQLEIFRLLKGFYPTDSKFVVLSMDMTYMKAGKLDQSFEDQLEELVAIKRQYSSQMLPFICVDPRRPDVLDLVRRYIEEHDFQGIKLYPPLDYYPFDDRLRPVYAYAEQNNVPITTHCSRGGVYYRGKITAAMRKHPKTNKPYPDQRENRDKFTEHLADPSNYIYVLEEFPNLRLCLAHFGGESEWKRYLTTSKGKAGKDWFSYIRDELFIDKYPNVYADISYTAHNRDFHPLLKVILQEPKVRPRVLYGSDFYMAERTSSERAFSVGLRAFLGEQDYWQIAETNPRQFLF